MSTTPALPPGGQIHPYLNFDGRAEEAIEFYKKTLGAQVQMLLRVKDGPPPEGNNPHPQIDPNKVMHSTLLVKGSILNATDGFCTSKGRFEGINLSLTLATPQEARSTFAALGEGGTVLQPIAPTFFSEAFGMVTDKFGVTWMVLSPAKQH